MRIVLALFAFCFVAQAGASPIAELGGSVVFERAADGKGIESRQPFAMHGGYRFEQADVFFEYSSFRASEGTSMIFVSREHQEFMLWARHAFFAHWRAAPYLALGGGFYYETIDTDLGAETSRETGSTESLYAAATGLRFAVTRAFEVSFETRASYAQAFVPSPLISVGLLAGFSF